MAGALKEKGRGFKRAYFEFMDRLFILSIVSTDLSERSEFPQLLIIYRSKFYLTFKDRKLRIHIVGERNIRRFKLWLERHNPELSHSIKAAETDFQERKKNVPEHADKDKNDNRVWVQVALPGTFSLKDTLARILAEQNKPRLQPQKRSRPHNTFHKGEQPEFWQK